MTTPLALTGQVVDVRDRPVALAIASTTPLALGPGTATTGHDGRFVLYFVYSGTVELVATSPRHGTSAPIMNAAVSLGADPVLVVLPPADDAMANGQFESGSLMSWTADGDVPVTVTRASRSGYYALQLGGPFTAPEVTAQPAFGKQASDGPWIGSVEQVVELPAAPVSPTLSLMYLVSSTVPLSNELRAMVISGEMW